MVVEERWTDYMIRIFIVGHNGTYMTTHLPPRLKKESYNLLPTVLDRRLKKCNADAISFTCIQAHPKID